MSLLCVSCALREVKLSVVSYLTNSIVDQILQELYSTHKALVSNYLDMQQFEPRFFSYISVVLKRNCEISKQYNTTESGKGYSHSGKASCPIRN